MCVVGEQGDVLQGGGVQLRSLHLSHSTMLTDPTVLSNRVLDQKACNMAQKKEVGFTVPLGYRAIQPFTSEGCPQYIDKGCPLRHIEQYSLSPVRDAPSTLPKVGANAEINRILRILMQTKTALNKPRYVVTIYSNSTIFIFLVLSLSPLGFAFIFISSGNLIN